MRQSSFSLVGLFSHVSDDHSLKILNAHNAAFVRATLLHPNAIDCTCADVKIGKNADLQRKIEPLQHGLEGIINNSIQDVFMQTLPSKAAEHLAKQRTASNRQSIIMVASLLDRVPNLAGLTRTCEVFKAEALVMADLNVIKQNDFAGISVTAEKHIPLLVSIHVPHTNLDLLPSLLCTNLAHMDISNGIASHKCWAASALHVPETKAEYSPRFCTKSRCPCSAHDGRLQVNLSESAQLLSSLLRISSYSIIYVQEVKPEGLARWLLQKKQEGYTILGLEQTSEALPLPDFQFSEKSVMLLGKEREGIPADLLSILDQALVIPQLGVIRSLNAHVSGSIALYEYTKRGLKRTS